MALLPVPIAVAPVNRYIAEKTLVAIKEGLLKDGGNLFRKLLRSTIVQAEDAFKEVNSEFRTHLGASQIGRECARDLWYGFRWATKREDREEFHKGPHDGVPCSLCLAIKARMIRLLNRGHLEEARFIALLQMIGCEVWTLDSDHKQFTVSMHGGHFGGSLDSVVRGIPDIPTGEPCLAEMKTSKDELFDKLRNQGLREGKPEHYTQMQIYMGKMGLRFGIYIAVNKDNDDLYAEIITLDSTFFEYNVDRAKKIVFAILPPQKISENSGWFKCKICNARPVCHKLPDANGNIPSPLKNCRTCVHSRPVEDGWICDHPQKVWHNGGREIRLTKEAQLKGCSDYVVIPGM